MTRCACCGRREADCPGGLWRGPRSPRWYGIDGVCVYCARAALRALDPPAAAAAIIPIRRAAPRRPPEPPEAA